MYQLRTWQGPFGDDYTERNKLNEVAITRRCRAFAQVLSHISDPANILEVGANAGINCHALSRVSAAELHAVEPNETAFAVLREQLGSRAHNTSAFEIPHGDSSIDLVFTSGVLIHIPPDRLRDACAEMFRVSRRYILAMEYFSKEPVEIPYRGQNGLLFKRDFGGYWLDHFSLKFVANGFFWQRTTGLDDVHWWLFEKRG